MAEETTNPDAGDTPEVHEQAAAQTGQRQVRVRVDERDRSTTYANAFRSNGTAEEVIVDFGMNAFAPAMRGGGEAQQQNVLGEVVFQVSDRIVMNYWTAKRLAINLGQIVRRYEDEYGELKLNAADRKKK